MSKYQEFRKFAVQTAVEAGQILMYNYKKCKNLNGLKNNILEQRLTR